LSAKLGANAAGKIGAEVGRTGKRIRQIQDEIYEWSRMHLTKQQVLAAHAHLAEFDIDVLPISPRPPSRAGRKPKKEKARYTPLGVGAVHAADT
jgi:hypothetical protein